MTSTVAFHGGPSGPWRVTGMEAVAGAGLPHVAAVTVGDAPPAPGGWCLRGVGSNHRYASRDELDELARRQPALGRPGATCAALIPIRKSAAWWAMAQDERLAVFAGHAPGHNAIGLDALPGVARRLLHCRDLDTAGGGGEPFDFLTWFEFAPADTPAFDDLLRRLRATAEWSFVEREVEIRLVRVAA